MKVLYSKTHTCTWLSFLGSTCKTVFSWSPFDPIQELALPKKRRAPKKRPPPPPLRLFGANHPPKKKKTGRMAWLPLPKASCALAPEGNRRRQRESSREGFWLDPPNTTKEEKDPRVQQKIPPQMFSITECWCFPRSSHCWRFPRKGNGGNTPDRGGPIGTKGQPRPLTARETKRTATPRDSVLSRPELRRAAPNTGTENCHVPNQNSGRWLRKPPSGHPKLCKELKGRNSAPVYGLHLARCLIGAHVTHWNMPDVVASFTGQIRSRGSNPGCRGSIEIFLLLSPQMKGP